MGIVKSEADGEGVVVLWQRYLRQPNGFDCGVITMKTMDIVLVPLLIGCATTRVAPTAPVSAAGAMPATRGGSA